MQNAGVSAGLPAPLLCRLPRRMPRQNVGVDPWQVLCAGDLDYVRESGPGGDGKKAGQHMGSMPRAGWRPPPPRSQTQIQNLASGAMKYDRRAGLIHKNIAFALSRYNDSMAQILHPNIAPKRANIREFLPPKLRMGKVGTAFSGSKCLRRGRHRPSWADRPASQGKITVGRLWMCSLP